MTGSIAPAATHEIINWWVCSIRFDGVIALMLSCNTHTNGIGTGCFNSTPLLLQTCFLNFQLVSWKNSPLHVSHPLDIYLLSSLPSQDPVQLTVLGLRHYNSTSTIVREECSPPRCDPLGCMSIIGRDQKISLWIRVSQEIILVVLS